MYWKIMYEKRIFFCLSGKRWKSMDAEKQAKYKQQYAKLREEYTAKLERFYEEHPDAKPSAYRWGIE